MIHHLKWKMIIFILISIFSTMSYAESKPWTFHKMMNGKLQTYIPEFSGTLVEENGTIFFIQPQTEKRTAIGNVYPLTLCQNQFASLCEIEYGVKYPDLFEEQKLNEPLYTFNVRFKNKNNITKNLNQDDVDEDGTSFHGLDEYIFASPNQEDAGSCLYMATTGAMEILMNKKIPPFLRKYEGNTDLSERFLMNAEAPETIIPNWRTDLIYTYNYVGGALLNKDYRYTKGWYKKVDGVLTKAKYQEVSSDYGPTYNWIDEYSDNQDLKSKLVKVLPVERDVLFEDAHQEVWNTAQMGRDDIEKIKNALKNRRSPVLVIYNHFAYWHAVLIVGFDDKKDNGNCPFVTRWIPFMKDKAEILLKSDDPKEKERGERYMRYVTQVENRWEKEGCQNKGVFYIRDSIYTGENDLIYDYDLSTQGEERPYAKKIVEKSYDWLYYLGNHAYVIYEK